MTAQDIAVALWVGVTLGICLIQQYELDQLKRQVRTLMGLGLRITPQGDATFTGSVTITGDPTQTELMQ